MSEKKQPLQCDVIGRRLVISIGIDTLAWASRERNGGPLPARIKITNQTGWAKDISNAIMKEDEVGNTMLSEMLDHAMQDAMNSGSVALVYPSSL